MSNTQQPYDEWIHNMERLEKEATSGPWYIEESEVRHDFDPVSSDMGYDESIMICDVPKISDDMDHFKANREFIRASRQFIPRALEELRKRDRALELAEQCLFDYSNCHDDYQYAKETLQRIKEVLK